MTDDAVPALLKKRHEITRNIDQRQADLVFINPRRGLWITSAAAGRRR